MFGQHKIPLCAQCDGWCLTLLGTVPDDKGVKPRENEVPMSKQPMLETILQVPRECDKCRPWMMRRIADWVNAKTKAEEQAVYRAWRNANQAKACKIVLPAKFVADTEHLLNMSHANIDWGTKGPNAELQLSNLVGGVRLRASEQYQYAFVKIAGQACRAVLSSEMAARQCCQIGAVPVATTWRPHIVPVARVIAVFPAPQGGQGPGSPPGKKPEDKPAGDAPKDDGKGDPPGGQPKATTDDTAVQPGTVVAPSAAPAKEEKSDLDKAIEAEQLSAQAGAMLDGTMLKGQTMPESSLEQKVAGGAKAEVTKNPLAVLPTPEDERQIGEREAFPRFPAVTDVPSNVFNNDPTNLEAAHAMRNRDVGLFTPKPYERSNAFKVAKVLKEEWLTRDNIQESLLGFQHYWDTLPSKWSGKTKQSVFANVSNEPHMSFEGYCRMVKAFNKAESSSKRKPRAVADHGPERLIPLAKVAWVFEQLMKKVSSSNIKGRPKEKALSELFRGFSGIDNLKMLVENDLTAFEFGVGETLKMIEADILNHIASHLRLDGFECAFERIVDSRTKAATWTMSYTDGAGAKQKLSIKLPRCMRESGDRLTSSGNWLQNVIAWFSFLCDPEHIEEAVKGWVKSGGRNFFYVSARKAEIDPKTGKYKKCLARMAFEGDDTAGGLEEEIPVEEIEEFFARWGWKPKIRVVKLKGYDYMEFVGERALMFDSKPVIVDGRLISAPPIKRLLKEKSWCTSKMLEKDRPGSLKLYAIRLAQQFRSVPSMFAFARAMYQDNKHGQSVDKGALEDYLRSLGEYGDRMPNLSKFPEPEDTNPEIWATWAEVTAGKSTDLERASMCGLTSLKQHGFDLQTAIPAAWRSSD